MKNLKKLLIAFIFTVLVSAFALAYSASAEIVEYGYFTFDTETGTIINIDYHFTDTLNIPSQINGVTVVSVYGKVFNEPYIKVINIPSTVEYIVGGALNYRNTDLEAIYVDDDNPYYCDVDGVLYDKDMTTLVMYPCQKGDTTVSFPKTVTKIGKFAIYGLRNIDVFDISNITSLGTEAFTGLQCKRMIVNSDLLEYGEDPFADDRQKLEFTIIDHVYFTGDSAGLWADFIKKECSNFTYNYDGTFKGEYELNGGTLYFDEETGTITGSIGISELDIPAEINGIKIVAIADNAFRNDSFLSVTIPGSIKTIEDRTFFDTNIAYLTISEGVEEIGELAFFNNQTLKSLTIPSSVKTVGIGAFEDNFLKELVISDGVEVIEKDAFYSIYNSIENLTIPGSVKTIGYNAFGECMKLKSLILEDGIETIGDYAFCYNNITELVIPQSVKSVGAGAFELCDELRSVTYYSSTDIDETAFNDCYMLEDIKVIEVEPEPSVSVDGLHLTVHNLDGVKDYFIAKGEYSSYKEIKANYVMRVTAARINGADEYTYTLKEPGYYTVYVRYQDGTKEPVFLYENISVTMPEFEIEGLGVTVSNLEDIKVIRTAPGVWTTAGEVKRAEGNRNFTANGAVKGAESYTLIYPEDGEYTIAVEYYNGLSVVKTVTVEHKEPEMLQEGNSVTFGNLDDLYVIRYVKGEYSSMGEIKRTAGSSYRKPRDIKNGVITINDLTPGIYTFGVQYNDQSYNYYTVVVE